MKRIFLLFSAIAFAVNMANAQTTVKAETKIETAESAEFTNVKNNPSTPVKNQAMTGTCWSFSTTSLLESQLLKSNLGNFDLSEMFTVRNIYVEKAKNYILRQGHAQFGEGGLGHDVIRSIAKYGAAPDDAYSGLVSGQSLLNHQKMVSELNAYLDSLLKNPATLQKEDWLVNYNKILDTYMGVMPKSFNYNGNTYTPLEFSAKIMKFNPDDYVNITSFTHQPYYQSFIIQVPDNFSNGSYYNLPLDEMISVVKSAINSGYSVMWDADVSNNGFRAKKGLALYLDPASKISADSLKVDTPEAHWDANVRQQLYEELVTQDDHLMHITGMEKSKGGKDFFIVKNSWGTVGPFNGFVNVSEAYFAINTISLVVPKAALSKALQDKLKLK